MWNMRVLLWKLGNTRIASQYSGGLRFTGGNWYPKCLPKNVKISSSDNNTKLFNDFFRSFIKLDCFLCVFHQCINPHKYNIKNNLISQGGPAIYPPRSAYMLNTIFSERYFHHVALGWLTRIIECDLKFTVSSVIA